VRDDAHEREEERLELSRFVDCADEGGGRPAGRGRPRAVEELKGELPPNEQHRGREAAYSRALADTMAAQRQKTKRMSDKKLAMRARRWHAFRVEPKKPS
jgi:hypothetical protein